MNELIQKLQQQAGLTPEQAQKSLQTIKQFVVEKFPMLAGAVDNIFPDAPAAPVPADSTAEVTPVDPTLVNTATATSYTPHDTAAGLHATAEQMHTDAGTPPPEKSFMDKISDFIPGQAGEKIEEFVKKAAHEADNLFKKH